MEVFRLLDELENAVRRGKRIPLSNRVSIDPDEFMEIIDHLRAVLPEELETAQQILANRDSLIAEARKEAENMFENSRSQMAALIENDAITKAAREAADKIVNRAHEVGEGIIADANQYAEELLTYMERVLNEGLASIRAGKEEISRQMKKPPSL